MVTPSTLLVVRFNSPISLAPCFFSKVLMRSFARPIIRFVSILISCQAEAHAYGIFTQPAGPNRFPLLFVAQTVSLRTSGDLTLHGTLVAGYNQQSWDFFEGGK